MKEHCEVKQIGSGRGGGGVNESKYSREDQVKFFKRLPSTSFTWSILEYIVPNES